MIVIISCVGFYIDIHQSHHSFTPLLHQWSWGPWSRVTDQWSDPLRPWTSQHPLTLIQGSLGSASRAGFEPPAFHHLLDCLSKCILWFLIKLHFSNDLIQVEMSSSSSSCFPSRHSSGVIMPLDQNLIPVGFISPLPVVKIPRPYCCLSKWPYLVRCE